MQRKGDKEKNIEQGTRNDEGRREEKLRAMSCEEEAAHTPTPKGGDRRGRSLAREWSMVNGEKVLYAIRKRMGKLRCEKRPWSTVDSPQKEPGCLACSVKRVAILPTIS